MELSRRLEQDLFRHADVPIPAGWGSPPTDVECHQIGALVPAIRRLDDRSDAVICWLLGGRARCDRLAITCLVVALAPLAISRCKGRLDRVDDYLTELVLVACDAEVASLRRSRRRCASVILDRAWDVLREPERRPSPVVLVDPVELGAESPAVGPTVEQVALGRAVVDGFRAELSRSAGSRRAAVAAWNSVVELIDRGDRSSRERRRWKYSREVLRRQGLPDLVA